jgi:hypothetical protein
MQSEPDAGIVTVPAFEKHEAFLHNNDLCSRKKGVTM